MDLSPNDIRGYEFRSQMRGYDKAEVDGFINQVAAALDELKQQNLRLTIEAESLRSQLAGLKQFEDTIKNAAIDARRNADLTMANAKQEAAMLITKAKQDAESIVVNRTREISEIETRITRLGLTKKSYLSKIRSLIQSHLDLINEIDSGDVARPEHDEQVKVTDSTDIATEKKEAVAPQTTDIVAAAPAAAVPVAEETDNGTSGRVDEHLAAKLKDAIQDDSISQSVGETIDPELAVALETYKRVAARKAMEQAVPVTPPAPPTPALGTVVETNLVAEDIPAGFIAKDGDIEDERSTDKVVVAKGKAAAVTEPNPRGGFGPSDSTKLPLSPDRLADELDEVAARFEEEMNRAAKN
ncbi:MAG: DivIVA domain-containing protein [Candidatus Zixiibacteriota bacterium]